jgi:hypothetical protein
MSNHLSCTHKLVTLRLYRPIQPLLEMFTLSLVSSGLESFLDLLPHTDRKDKCTGNYDTRATIRTEGKCMLLLLPLRCLLFVFESTQVGWATSNDFPTVMFGT